MINEDTMQQLANLKSQLDPTGQAVYTDEMSQNNTIFNEAEQEELKVEFLQQYKDSKTTETKTSKVRRLRSGPKREENVEVSYFGDTDGVGVITAKVDISFDDTLKGVTPEQHALVRKSLQTIALATNINVISETIQLLKNEGQTAFGIIFRECRQIDLVTDNVRQQVIHLLGSLAYRDLNSRLLLKGILEHSSSTPHLRLAIGTAGVIRDQQTINAIEKCLMNEELFLDAFKALFQIHNPKSLENMIIAINSIDPKRKDIIDEIVKLANKFNSFGSDAIDPLFAAYLDCQNRSIRPIYIKAVRSFGVDALDKMVSILQDQRNDERVYFQMCQTIGGLRNPAAIEVLKKELSRASERQKANIINGLGHTGESDLTNLILEELKIAKSDFVRSAAIKALAFLSKSDNLEVLNTLQPYKKYKEHNVHVDAIYTLARLDDKKSLDELIDFVLNGNENERSIATNGLVRLRPRQSEKAVERLLSANDEQSLHLILALQRFLSLPPNTGNVLKEKLKQSIMPLLEKEIYSLIAKHLYAKSQILPSSFLYDAREQTSSDRLKRELTKMLSNAKNNTGVLTV